MGLFDGEAKQLTAEGKLGPIQDICEFAAQRTFIARFATDTAPIIAQMIIDGQEIPHWYYRSEEWIDQPYLLPLMGYVITPFRGPTFEAYPLFYGEDAYKVHEAATKLARRLATQ